MRLFWPSLALMALLGGCVNLAPDYQRPEAPVSEQWLPAAAANPSASASVPTDIEWQNFFTDNRLVRLQTLALINNRDLRLASLNVEKAQAQYRIERAASLPTIDASGSATHTRTSASTSTTGRSSINHEYSAQLGLSSYELDVFGRIQNLQDEALEDYLALTETRRSTQISLIAEVATGWLTLAADNQLLKLAEDTLASQRQSYDLTQRSHALGGSSGLEVAQAQTTVESARGDVAQYQSQVLQDRNALRLLVGSDIPDALLPAA
ncbi:TolC family protein, partial [Pseudomonas syringae]